MNKIVLSFFLLLGYYPCFGQTDTIKVTQIRQFGSFGPDKAAMVRADLVGNTYITGGFSNTINWGGTTLTASSGIESYYVASYNPQLQLRWVRQSDGAGYDEGYNVAVDNTNVYSTGNFQGSSTGFFGVNGVAGAVAVGLNTNTGATAFSRDFSAVSGDQARGQAIASDRQGNVYVGYQGSGYRNSSIAKINANTGAVIWSRPQPSNGEIGSNDVLVVNGRVFSSLFVESGFIDGMSVNRGPNLVELSPSTGQILRVFSMAGFEGRPLRLTGAPDGSVFFQVNAIGTPLQTQRQGTVIPNATEKVIARFSPNGALLQIYRTGSNDVYGFSGLALTTDGRLVTGLTVFDGVNNQLGTISGRGGGDLLLQSFDTATALPTAQVVFGGIGTDRISGVSALPDGKVAITGWFSFNADFGPGRTLTSAGDVDIFLAVVQIKACSPLPASPIAASQNMICPNSTLSLTAPNIPDARCLWSTTDSTNTITISAPGRYSVRVYNSCTNYRDTIDISAALIPSISVLQDDTICAGDTIITRLSFTNVTTKSIIPFSNQPTPRANLSLADSTYTFIAPSGLTQPQTYRYNLRMVSSDQCMVTKPFSIMVKPSLIPVVVRDSVCYSDSKTVFFPSDIPGIVFKPFRDNPSGLTDSGNTFSVSNLGLPERTISFRILSSAPSFCQATNQFIVKVRNIPEVCEPLLIPNVVTPYSDDLNDVFRLGGVSPKGVSLTLYDRWGKEIYANSTYTKEWPSSDTPPGIYYYQVSIPARGLFDKRGWVEVIK